jgi:hypothetical protein
MANREKGEVSLPLLGRTLTLVMNTNAQASIEEATGETWDAFFERMLDPKSARILDVRMVVWGMTRKYHPELTLAQVGELIDEIGGVPGVARLLMGPMVEASTPDKADVEALGLARPPKATSRPRRRRGGAVSTFQPMQ